MKRQWESRYTTGVTPSGTKEMFHVSPVAIEQMEESGRHAQLDALYSAAEVVLEPVRIYRGLRRPSYEGAYCYVGRPNLYDDDKVEPAPDGFVFLVFIMDWVIFEWRWERCNVDDPLAPENADTRFDQPVKIHAIVN